MEPLHSPGHRRSESRRKWATTTKPWTEPGIGDLERPVQGRRGSRSRGVKAAGADNTSCESCHKKKEVGGGCRESSVEGPWGVGCLEWGQGPALDPATARVMANAMGGFLFSEGG